MVGRLAKATTAWTLSAPARDLPFAVGAPTKISAPAIDEQALTRMLETGEMAGPGLDVFDHEPAVFHKLVRLGNAGKVMLLPHM